MKILFLTPQLPYPPHQGTTLRNFNIVKQLAPRHEIHLLTFGTPADLNASPLRDYCTRIELAAYPARSMPQRALETLFHPLPDMARRLYSPPLTQTFANLMAQEQYNIVQVEGIEMANAALGGLREWKLDPESAAAEPFRSPAIVFDDHNAEWTLQKTAYETDRKNPKRLHAALYSWIQYHKLKRFERMICKTVAAVAAVSQQDADALTRLDPSIKPVVIPNGVDTEHYVPSLEGVCAKPLAELSVVFTGKMDFRPNVDACMWFADEILPPLRNIIPLAHVSFVGQKPSPKVQALKERPGVEVTGFVSDTRPYIADAAVFAVPLRMGSGTRLKVLEAMAMGKAIVSTTFGVSGIEYENGRDVIIADDPNEFARAIAMLMRDHDKARALGAAARELAVEKYEWKKLVPRFEGIYESARLM